MCCLPVRWSASDRYGDYPQLRDEFCALAYRDGKELSRLSSLRKVDEHCTRDGAAAFREALRKYQAILIFIGRMYANAQSNSGKATSISLT